MAVVSVRSGGCTSRVGCVGKLGEGCEGLRMAAGLLGWWAAG